MDKTIRFFVSEYNNGDRLDVYLSSKIDNLTRSFIKKIIIEKNVRINNEYIVSPSKKIKKNDEILVKIYNKIENNLAPSNIKLDIVHEDKDIIIINKPKGMVVHPGTGNFENTLANALAFKYSKNLSNINGSLRPGIVHRLDKDTSGLLVVAKNNLSHFKLGEQFNNHTIKRKYKCLIWGVLRPLNGQIKTLITRSKKNRQLMIASEISGKKAVTNYKTKKVYETKEIPKISLIECNLETGRTHQIRVHLKYKKTSILGDNQYGKKNIRFKNVNKNFIELLNRLKGQTLHAETLEFIHPTRNKLVKFRSDIPSDFKKMLNLLEKLLVEKK